MISMYEGIYLLNRIGLNGKPKDKDLSLITRIITFGLFGLLFLFIVLMFISFNSVSDSFTLRNILNAFSSSKMFLFSFIGVILNIIAIKYMTIKSNQSVSFMTNMENGLLTIMFLDGRLQGVEYSIFLSDITDVSCYKDGTFSLYSNDIQYRKGNKTSYFKGKIRFVGGDSRDFVLDLQDYVGNLVKFKNKRNKSKN